MIWIWFDFGWIWFDLAWIWFDSGWIWLDLAWILVHYSFQGSHSSLGGPKGAPSESVEAPSELRRRSLEGPAWILGGRRRSQELLRRSLGGLGDRAAGRGCARAR